MLLSLGDKHFQSHCKKSSSHSSYFPSWSRIDMALEIRILEMKLCNKFLVNRNNFLAENGNKNGPFLVYLDKTNDIVKTFFARVRCFRHDYVIVEFQISI